MRLADLVADVHGAFDVPAAMSDVAELCRHDRYQASAGIEAAAGYVAERATDAGLADVQVLRFPADGARRWWTFAAPLPWTPLRATLHVGGRPLIRYPEQPYALAANSAPTPPRGVRLPIVLWPAGEHGLDPRPRHDPCLRLDPCLRPDPAGAVVVLEGTPLPAALPELVARGAAGVITDPLAGRGAATAPAEPPMITDGVGSGCGATTPVDSFGDHGGTGGAARGGAGGGGPPRWPGQVGRLELPAGCPLFAFSATTDQVARLRRAAKDGATADVVVQVGTEPATLPVVTARLPGTGSGSLLLSAHLCHPRPGANDNASGVAALLGIARVGAALGGAGVRFVWGPEFVGMAAYLHDVVHAGRVARPVAAVNVDMAGEDQRSCGGPLVIERAPDELPSPLSAVAVRVAALIPPAARSYSGAVPCDTWAWRDTPYVGASDHAMLAGPPTACPAISLGHWPDAANHTSADTIELVDPRELRRTATIAGATIAAMGALGTPDKPDGPGDLELASDVVDATVAWAASHVLSALPGARGRPAPPPPDADGPVLDPLAPEHAARLLEHRGAVAVAAVRSLHGTAVPAATVNRAASWLAALTAHAAGRVPGPARPTALGTADADANRSTADAGTTTAGTVAPVLTPAWHGPFNLRHLAECAAEEDSRWLAEVSARDRGGSYARLLALARGLDGRRDGTAVAWWAAVTSELAIPVPTAQRFLRLLRRAGWACTESTMGEARCW